MLFRSPYRILLYANPLTPIIEMLRAVVLRGVLPDAPTYLATLAGALLVFYAGRTLFMRKKSILVDVI